MQPVPDMAVPTAAAAAGLPSARSVYGKPAPEWRHADQQRALSLLTAHLGYASQARAALVIIEGIADPCVTTLEAYVREAAQRKQIRPLMEQQ